MPAQAWKPLEEYAPFVRELVEFMWEARPPLNPTQFARRAGVRKQLISSWLQSPSDTVISPEPRVVVRLARAMGRPVKDLFQLAGHTDPGDPLFDLQGAWDYVLARVEYALTFSRGENYGQDKGVDNADAAGEDGAEEEHALAAEQVRALRDLFQQLRDEDLRHWTGGPAARTAAPGGPEPARS